MSGRRPNLESSVYFSETDGRWHGWVTMGVKSDGRPDRRHRSAATEAQVRKKVRELERQRDAGRVSKPGRKPTIEQWMTTYLDTVAALKVKPRTLDDYWSKARNDIFPHIGKHRIDRLRPEHLDELMLKLRQQGHAPSHILKVFRIVSRALKIAVRRELVARNVAELVDPPSVEETEARPFSQDEAVAFLQAAVKRRNPMRWAIGVSLGLRQGEALGLRWQYVDLERGHFNVWWQLQRLKWRHGCENPHACGARLHRKPCREGCRHVKQCPAPCAEACTAHASSCPQRLGGGLVITRLKTTSSKGTVPIPPPLIPYLKEHRAAQDEERQVAGELWQDNDLVFCQANGRPIDPRHDWQEFKDLLAEAGVSDRRPHDGSRHTAGTFLNALGVDVPTVMQILRHAQFSMYRRYVHTSTPQAKEAVSRVGAALWPEPRPEAGTATKTATNSSREERAKRRRRVV